MRQLTRRQLEVLAWMAADPGKNYLSPVGARLKLCYGLLDAGLVVEGRGPLGDRGFFINDRGIARASVSRKS
jgi:hypothetical protein